VDAVADRAVQAQVQTVFGERLAGALQDRWVGELETGRWCSTADALSTTGRLRPNLRRYPDTRRVSAAK
jgi:hypothetical protein